MVVVPVTASPVTARTSPVMRVFLTHNAEDLDAYYARALGELRAIADVTTNPHERDLTTAELIEAAAGCDVIIAHRSTPGKRRRSPVGRCRAHR